MAKAQGLYLWRHDEGWLMHLYDYILSGSCYKVRLLLSLLGKDYNKIAVDFHPGMAHKKPNFLAVNPSGTLPVFKDGDITLCDTQAILSYIALKYDPSGEWFPTDDPSVVGHIMQWLAFASRLTDSAGQARLHDMLGRELDIDVARFEARKAMRELEAYLTEREFLGQKFLVTGKPTIADIACFPYVALSPDGGIDHDEFPALRRWMIEIRRFDKFIEMPGIHRLHDQRDVEVT
jgi:glutathione S-transferase